MRRTTSSQSQPVSLFPFLAVLICMMGALVLLLLGLTSTMRQRLGRPVLVSISAPASPGTSGEDQIRPPSPPLPGDFDQDAIAEVRIRRDLERRAHWQGVLDQLTAERDRLKELIEAQRLERNRRQSELETLGARLESHSDHAVSDQATVGILEERQKQSELELESLAKRIALTERNLEELRLRQAESGNAHAILPYDGRSGTVRRPVYIECSDKGYRFLPEDVFVGPNELRGATTRSNSLAFGAKALLRYWTLRNVRDPGRNPRPYLLLVVRPGGIFAYDAARQLLSRLETSFGYELVEDEIQLQKLPPDPQAVALLKEAIALAADQGGTTPGTEINHSSRKSESWEQLSANGSLTPSEFNRRGQGSEPGESGGGDRSESHGQDSETDLGGLMPRGGPGSEKVVGHGSGIAPRTVRDPLPRPRAASLGGRTDGDEALGPQSPEGRSDPSVMRNEQAAPPQRLPSEKGGLLTDEAASADAHGTAPALGTLAGPESDGVGLNLDSRERGWQGENNSATESPDSVPRRPVHSGTQKIVEGSAAATAPVGKSPLTEAVSSSEPERDLPRSLSAGESRTRKEEGASEVSRGGGVRTNERTPIHKPSADEVFSRRTGEPGANPQRMGGGGAGGNPRNLIALQRKILIRVERTQVVVGDEDPITIPVKKNQKADQLIAQVTGAMRDVVDSWGAPPARFYWNPAVRFEVTRDGNAVYERLRGAFERQKVSTSADYIDGTGSQPGGRS